MGALLGAVAGWDGQAIVRVFFATDRNLTSSDVDAKFGATRSKLKYGTCDVSIPRDHRIGQLETRSLLRMEFRDDPAKHVLVVQTSIQPKDKFFSDLAARIRGAPRKNAFVFVHGYNVTFEDAARRTAQISYDLAFDGAPVFYSWPSQGTFAGYMVDETNIEWAQTNLTGFLADVLGRSDAENVYLIAHSMGNRALTRAVASLLNEKPALRYRLRELILTAPDIDAEVFKRDIAPVLAKEGQSVTLYAASEDIALATSRTFHGYPRAGDSGKDIVVAPGIETIDATGVDTSFVGHTYFAQTRSVLSDIFYLIRDGRKADERFGLRRVQVSGNRYWVFKR